ncbi:MAG: TetR/AcrR family transcriptional regulator [Solirubrobacteraceae bacterium]
MPTLMKAKPTGRTRPTRAQTCTRVLQAAGEVFAARGFDGASIDEIAAAAGLTKGAVYSNFASKDDLFFAVIEDRLVARLSALSADIDGPSSPERFMSGVAERLAEMLISERAWNLLFIEFWARAVRDPRVREEWARHRRRARKLVAESIEQHTRANGVELPAPADELAVAVIALSNGIAMEHLADPASADPKLFADALGLLLRSRTAEPTAASSTRTGER